MKQVIKYRIVVFGKAFYPEKRGWIFWHRFRSGALVSFRGVSVYSDQDGIGLFSFEDAEQFIKDYIDRKGKIAVLLGDK